MNPASIAVVDGSDLRFLAAVIDTAIENGQSVSFYVAGGVKVKRGESIWTLPFGTTLG